ncbi:52 kDa repressor of the inhibitor of the protein kinase-like [Bufo bufo]|uniref:52 kDa repressor of the inhibitor of the protein kinase-like n=1 Tax=Bufo bufo TaxID=8384 RepID=UPI001ABE89ED|nr:52 kDa repressor of the inhibitor of the protein kinase-like [Bufo bufo]
MELQSQIEKEKQKWRDILRRILHCIKFLATQNLALRGHRESLQLDDDSNVGNFLGLLKLLAIFDPVMKEHLSHVESHPGSTSYLSPGVQNEFIHMMASTVRQSLLTSIHKAKYYGLMFDSTPDHAHREQMSEVVRYVEVDFESKIVCVRESFLGFIQISQKDAESLVEDILKQLEKDGMELQDCRSQCYDNAAVMAGHKSGVHQRISEKNNLAVFVNCNNHSLNLVGVHAAKQDTMMVTFFGTIEALYVFFSRSTQRWEKLKNAVPMVVKSESETRWSARTEAVKPVNNYFEEIVQVLQDMTDNENETSETRSDARQLCNRMLSYDFLTLLGFWNKVLICIDRIQKRLQDPSMNFHDAALDLKALRDHFDDDREVLVSESLEEGLSLCQDWNIEVERRRRRKKQMPGENLRDVGLSAKEEMERVMKGTLVRLHREMDEKFTRLHDTDAKFGFLLDVGGLCSGAYNNDLKKKCENLAEFYSSDVDGQQLYEEILDCRMLLLSRANMKISRPKELLEFIVQYGDESVFPNLRIAIQIMLTIAVSIASCERSFSKLKLILSYLRASMGQDRLCDLALLSVEREETEKTDFEQIIDQFASVKARRVQF